MTREQEINLIADCAVPDDKYKDFKDGIVWGAKWADKNPQHSKEGFIKKACKWLSDNKDNYIIDIEGEILIDDQIIKDFCKVMEE